MEFPLLRDIVVIFALSIGVLLLCHRMRIPSIVGFILTGILAGPHGFGLISAIEQVDILAKIGVILLLFTIGMEFSPRRILEMSKGFFIGGVLQVGFTVLGGFVVATLLGRPFAESIFLGFLLSLSSTAIVIKMLTDRGKAKSRHGRLILAILIFQDVVVVLMMLLVPFLAGYEEIPLGSFPVIIAKGVLIISLAFVFAIKVVPPLLDHVARTRSRELFLLTVLAICFSVTWSSSLAGLSISLGAFLSGMILSESEYRHQALGNILPFQDIFTSFFFISIGMLLQLDFLYDHLVLVLVICFGVLLLKGFVAGNTSLILGMSLRTSIIVGFALCQVGEFAFVLAQAGMRANLGEPYLYQLFLSVSIFTMLFTPLLIIIAPYAADFICKLPLPHRLLEGKKMKALGKEKELIEHVIIAGFGSAGKNLAKTCKMANLKYCILDANLDTVREERKKGEPIFFGDAGHTSVLQHVNADKASTLAVLINNKDDEKRVIEAARKINSKMYIVARTSLVLDRETLLNMGADEVIVDEFESAIEVVNRILSKYEISYSERDRLINLLAGEQYEALRELKNPFLKFTALELDLPDMVLDAWTVEKSSSLSGLSIQESNLRPRFGISVLIIIRDSQNITDITSETKILEGDKLVIFGKKDHLIRAEELFKETASQ